MGASAKLLQIYRHLWTSYWCIPVAILLGSMLLAASTIWLDQIFIGDIDPDFIYLRRIEPETARVILSMVAGSIIGVAGVVFSITMVAVSFASGTFGPRLIGNMMRDRGSQVSLGCFIGTFVYALIVLRFVRVNDTTAVEAFAPYISIGTAMALAVFCMMVLIYFIHHAPGTINIELIIAKLGRTLKSGTEERFPAPDKPVPLRSGQDHWIDDLEPDDAIAVEVNKDGYVQALDLQALDSCARTHGLRIEILCRPGAFVTSSHPVMRVWLNGELGDDVLKALRRAYAIGASPTVNQNIEFVANQLVEIIARALSPGINDPFTAIACINWLQVGIEHYAKHESLHDSFNAAERVYSKPYLFSDFATVVFDAALPYIVTNRQVARHTDECLQVIESRLPNGTNRDVVNEILEKLRRAQEENGEPK